MAGSSRLKPGDSGTVKVVIDTRNKIGSELVKIVEVFSNDPRKPRVMLILKARI